MSVVSIGEEVPISTVLEIVDVSLEKFKILDEAERVEDRHQIAEELVAEAFKPPIDSDTRSKHEIWKMKVDALREFCLPNQSQPTIYSKHIKFLEAVKKYISP